MNYYDNALIAQSRQQRIEQQADQDHLAAIANNDGRSKISELYAPALAKAGDLLVEVGQQLQRRYGQPSESIASPVLADAK